MATNFDDHEAVRKMAEEAFKKGGSTGLTEFATTKLNEWREVHVNIAVVGESGAGKSSFINTIRCRRKGENGFAEVGVTECTQTPKSYPFPENAKISLWDLPGAGTDKFKADEYTTKMKFSTYDAFVILSSERFKEIDTMLAKEIQKLNKPFFFARTKMDNAMRDEKRNNKKSFKASSTSQQIRADCEEQLGEDHKERIFLIANLLDDDLKEEFTEEKYPDIKFENEDLTKAIAAALPKLQKQALVFSLTCTSSAMIALKTEEISARFKIWATVSAVAAATAAVMPFASVAATLAVDVPIFLAEMIFQKVQLGIDNEYLQKQASIVSWKVEELIARVKTVVKKKETLEFVPSFPFNIPPELLPDGTIPLATEVFQKVYRDMIDFMLEMMLKDTKFEKTAHNAAFQTGFVAVRAPFEGIEAAASLVPVLGSLVGFASSWITTYFSLVAMLSANAEIAKICILVIEQNADELMANEKMIAIRKKC